MTASGSFQADLESNESVQAEKWIMHEMVGGLSHDSISWPRPKVFQRSGCYETSFVSHGVLPATHERDMSRTFCDEVDISRSTIASISLLVKLYVPVQAV